MSLLLNLIRQLLEYYGVAPEPFLQRCTFCLNGIVRMIGSHLSSTTFLRTPFQELCVISRNCLISWVSKRKKYGSSRSLIRRLGGLFSLTPCARPHIQMAQSHTTVNFVQPSLADALVMGDEVRNRCTQFRSEEWRGGGAPSLFPEPTLSKGKTKKASAVDEDAFQKIHVLENELAHLRRQIADILAADRVDQSSSNTVTSSNTPSGFSQTSECSTPTPVCNVAAIPPPPPLPPLCVLKSDFASNNSAVELIKQRRAAKTSAMTDDTEWQKVRVLPDMMDVLKDISNVKLKAVEKSPGGTPLPKGKKTMRSRWDPAALIAKALQEKFAAQGGGDDSFDKENSSYSASPFSSPDTPMVSCCVLKPNMKQEVLELRNK